MKSLILSLFVALMLVGCGSEDESFNIDNYLEDQTVICESVHYKMTQYCYNDCGYDLTSYKCYHCTAIKDADRCPRVVSFISDKYEKDGILLHLNEVLVDRDFYCWDKEEGGVSCSEINGEYCYEYLDENDEHFYLTCAMN